jgi:hypothetical protein
MWRPPPNVAPRATLRPRDIFDSTNLLDPQQPNRAVASDLEEYIETWIFGIE